MSGGSVPVAAAKVVLPPPFPDAPKTLTFVHDERLEACLRDFRSSPAARHLSFALVDLTTVMEGSQFKGPFAYAALRDDKRYYVASLAKIAIILAAYRLRRSVADAANVSQAADAKTLFADIATAWRGPINKLFSGPADDFPKLNRIFDVSGPPGGRTIRFTDKFWKQLVGIVQNSNRAAADCISDIGFNFINGTLVKEGLVDEKKQGLWLGGSYSATTWESTKYRMHGATALSVARFFTLLHTGQLVDHEASRNMRVPPGLRQRLVRHASARREVLWQDRRGRRSAAA